MGSALEIYPVPHTYTIKSYYGGLSDTQKIASDWYRVGSAFYSIMNSGAENSSVEEKEQLIPTR